MPAATTKAAKTTKSPEHGPLASALEGIVGAPGVAGNRVEVLRNGDEIFPAMLAAIAGAQEHIDLLTFVYWRGDVAREFAQALGERARAGVEVRVLIDAIGGRLLDDDLVTQMLQDGCDVQWFRPLTSQWKFWNNEHRTHRKILVVDGRIGFTGGVGIADEWSGCADGPDSWRDTHLRITGPAVIALRAGFATNWLEASQDDIGVVAREGAPGPAGDTLVQVVRGQPGLHVSDVALALRLAIRYATERLWIATAYFAPDEELAELLCDAVDRGVDVRILIPGPHIDKRVSRIIARAAFDRLLDGGVQISEFLPTMLHCKVLITDDAAVVGSANVNGRSMEQDDELIAVIHDPAVAGELAQHFLEDLERAEPIVEHRWVDRPAIWRLRDRVMAKLQPFA